MAGNNACKGKCSGQVIYGQINAARTRGGMLREAGGGNEWTSGVREMA